MSTFVLLDDGHTSFMATPDEYQQRSLNPCITAIAGYGFRMAALVVFDHDARL